MMKIGKTIQKYYRVSLDLRHNARAFQLTRNKTIVLNHQSIFLL